MTAKLRRKAVLFYYNQPTLAMEDWIEGRADGQDIDPDVRELVRLLTVVASEAYERSADAVKHLSHEDGLGMGSQRIESAILGLRPPSTDINRLRTRWLDELGKLSDPNRVQEIRKMLHGALDVVEKTGAREPVVAAFNAFEAKLI